MVMSKLARELIPSTFLWLQLRLPWRVRSGKDFGCHLLLTTACGSEETEVQRGGVVVQG